MRKILFFILLFLCGTLNAEIQINTAATGDMLQSIYDPLAINADVFDHGNNHISSLADDDHLQYGLLLGRSGGQTFIGGIDASDNLTLQSTSNATKGKIFFGANSVYDEVNDRLGIGIISPVLALEVSGDILANGGVIRFQKEGVSATARGTVWSNTITQSAIFRFVRGLGTEASPLPVTSGTNLGSFQYLGYYDTSNTFRQAELLVEASEDWDASNRGVKISFQGTKNGSTTRQDWLVLENGNADFEQGGIKFNGFLDYGSSTELTISGGVVTATKSYHTVDTQADDATDELDTINGGSVGRILILTSANSTRDTTLKHATGNLRLSQGNDFTLDNINATIQLLYNGSNWIEISRSANI